MKASKGLLVAAMPIAFAAIHDDAEREYAYGPADSLPDTKVGAVSRALMDEGERARLGRDQHEERLEDDLPGGTMNGTHDRLSFAPRRAEFF